MLSPLMECLSQIQRKLSPHFVKYCEIFAKEDSVDEEGGVGAGGEFPTFQPNIEFATDYKTHKCENLNILKLMNLWKHLLETLSKSLDQKVLN